MFQAIEKIGPSAIQSQRNLIILQGKAKDVEKRLRWDCFYSAGLTRFACDNIYQYADDTHIDTALRTILKQLNV